MAVRNRRIAYSANHPRTAMSTVCQDDSFSLQQKRRLRRSANLLYFFVVPVLFFSFPHQSAESEIVFIVVVK